MQTTLFTDIFLEHLSANSHGILAKPLEIAQKLLETEVGPSLICHIQADLDRHAVAKKRKRKDEKRVVLDKAGRKRTAPVVVYFLAVASGTIENCFGKRGYGNLVANCDLHRALAMYGVSKLPCRSACHELVNAISRSTMELIIQAQLSVAQDEGLDDLQCVIGDSTATQADSAKPNNGRIFVHLANRALLTANKLDQRLGLGRGHTRADGYLRELQQLKFKLLTSKHTAAERIAIYERMLDVGAKLLPFFEAKSLDRALETEHEPVLHKLSTHYTALYEMWFQIYQELYPEADIGEAPTICRSVSDPDASFIIKGHRPTVFGYRPHLACSAGGLVTGMDLESGNPSDSKRFVPLLNTVLSWTGQVPTCASFDSGYASNANVVEAKKLGVEQVSFAGSTGKLILGEKWNEQCYVDLRRKRNSVEALIGHFKHCYGLRRFTVRNLDSARHQMLRSIIAYNFERIAILALRKFKANQKAEKLAS